MTQLNHPANPTHDVTPAQAGAHPEISGWVPAFAGMTPWIRQQPEHI
ncbi:MAG: hypothetical protein JWR51_1278 [Devosia sp.]|nr:hypothetical protein [Devosia sp.]